MLEETAHSKIVKQNLSCTKDITRIVNTDIYKSYSKDRKGDKKRVELIVGELASNTGMNERDIKRRIYNYYISNVLSKPELMQLIGPVIPK